MVEGIKLQEGKEVSRHACLYARRGAPTVRPSPLRRRPRNPHDALRSGGTLLAQPGEAPVKGTEDIRAALQALLATEPTFTSQARRVFEADDLALSFADWTLTGTGPNSKAVEMSGQTSDVLRKQVDGIWRFVIDNPYGSAHGF